jgi:LCP family protein required for cell wall assembly
VVVTVLTGLFSFAAFTVARQVAIDTGNAGIQFVSPDTAVVAAQPNATPIATAIQQVAVIQPTPLPGQTLQPTPPQPTPTLDPAADYIWKDPRRFNILLLGIDQRSAVEEKGPFRTDTIMVISVDPVKKTVGVLSIPRDLWVKIPGYTQGRINTANSLGDSDAYPGGGAALAAETIRQNLGIQVDKYLRINFDVFTTLVTTIAPDGVEICVSETIDDPNYPDAGYGFIHVHFDPGCQVLNAEKLLQYARTRHTEKSDFDRARRQQEVIKAMREKLLNVGGITHFIGQAPNLWTKLTGSFTTNLTLDEILSLGSLMQQIPKDNIRFGVIDNMYVDLTATTAGDKVLVPRSNAIRLLVQQVFDPQEDLTLSDLRQRADSEKASIAVLNNTDISGIAGQTRDWLAGKGVTVAKVDSAASPTSANTLIRVYNGKVWTGRYLAALLGLPADRVEPGTDAAPPGDIAILVGPDIKPLLSKQ